MIKIVMIINVKYVNCINYETFLSRSSLVKSTNYEEILFFPKKNFPFRENKIENYSEKINFR